VNESWDRLTAIFDAARLLDTSARGAFLDAACGADAGLRAEIESLLAQNVTVDRFLAEPPADLIAAAIRDKAALEPGLVLNGRYCVEDALASGGQAIVYRATDRLLSRPVVIKVLNAAGRQNEWLRSRLRQEMEALARIDHPGVVGILDTGELADGSPFLVIQYIDGMSLREVLRAGRVVPRRAAAILRQAGSALAAAHSLGICHRDLKPENIMLQRLGGGAESVKLIDFGIAKIERSGLQPGTTTVMLAGTVRYMAPEQFEGDHSPASDIYSLALVACEMLCGIPDLRALPARFGRGVRRGLETALAFKPQDRPKDTAAWSAALAHKIASAERGRLRRAVAAACLLIVLTLAVILMWRGARAPEDTARIIEKVGAFDPVHEGFRIHNEVSATVVSNADGTGYEAWRMSTSSLGYYYRPLSEFQKRRALERGWNLAVVVRAEGGTANAGVDFVPLGKRFDINNSVDPGGDTVRLLTQIVPIIQGFESSLPRPAAAYHRYEMRYDPGLQSAELWVDGQRMLRGYRGHSQYQDNMGVTFGVGAYKGRRGVASFKSVRFEINP